MLKWHISKLSTVTEICNPRIHDAEGGWWRVCSQTALMVDATDVFLNASKVLRRAMRTAFHLIHVLSGPVLCQSISLGGVVLLFFFFSFILALCSYQEQWWTTQKHSQDCVPVSSRAFPPQSCFLFPFLSNAPTPRERGPHLLTLSRGKCQASTRMVTRFPASFESQIPTQ